LYLDEFQTFVSLDIVKMLDQVRKFRLFTVLAHQRFGQLDQDLCDSVLTNCRIKAVFGGLPVESARMMAQELFIGELDPKKTKSQFTKPNSGQNTQGTRSIPVHQAAAIHQGVATISLYQAASGIRAASSFSQVTGFQDKAALGTAWFCLIQIAE
jgi:type IV secretory system conjugative DNA transfer VirD4/TraG family protein